MKLMRSILFMLLMVGVMVPAAYSGHAIEFVGQANDYQFVVLDPALLDGLTDCSVEYWIYIDQNGEDRFATTFSAYGNGNQDNEYTHFFWYPNEPEDVGLTPFIKGNWPHGGSTFPMHEWFHVAVTREADGTVNRYINGTLAESRPFTGGALSVASIYLGIDQDQLNGGFDEPLNGAIDELRIWGDVRTAQEIADNMNDSVDPQSADLIAYYNFDDGTGQTVADITGNGHDGTLGSLPGADDNDPSWVDSDLPQGQPEGHLFYPGWSLMSVPVEPDLPNDPVSLFDDDIESLWSFYQFLYSTGYFEPAEVHLGPGYWLALAHDTTTITVQGTDYTGTFTRPLELAWNIIGTPYTQSVDLEDVVFGYDGNNFSLQDAVDSSYVVPLLWGCTPQEGYFFTTTLDPWYGYWILSLVDGLDMQIPQPLGETEQGGSELDDERGDYSAENWLISIVARQGDNVDRTTFFGVNEYASDGFDLRYDFPAPPAQPEGDWISAYAQKNQWLPDLGEQFNYDIRAPFSGSSEYQFFVETTADGEATLSWPSLENTLAADVETVELEDVVSGTTVNMQESSDYSYQATAGAREFIIHVTVAEFDVPESDVQVPESFKVGEAYPNPFNPSVTVPFSLPQSGQVTFTVYNVAGQQLFQQAAEYEAGSHNFEFDAAGNGNDLVSGLYFIRAQYDGLSSTIKVMLLK